MNKMIMASALSALPLVTGCTLTLVQPYDAQLYENTEQFYTHAATLLLEGEYSSPANTRQLAALSPQQANEHPGHYSHFQPQYDKLLVESNTLILRSLVNTGTVSEPGKRLQANVERFLQRNFSAQCDTLQKDFPDADLTTRNYIDLKCLVAKWQDEHHQADKKILYKANWQGRSRTLFYGILALQSAEASKQHLTGENQ